MKKWLLLCSLVLMLGFITYDPIAVKADEPSFLDISYRSYLQTHSFIECIDFLIENDINFFVKVPYRFDAYSYWVIYVDAQYQYDLFAVNPDMSYLRISSASISDSDVYTIEWSGGNNIIGTIDDMFSEYSQYLPSRSSVTPTPTLTPEPSPSSSPDLSPTSAPVSNEVASQVKVIYLFVIVIGCYLCFKGGFS